MANVSDLGRQSEAFLALHRREKPLLLPNPWDAGSALVLESLGFEALATTSSGSAAARGRLDYGLTREQAIRHAGEIVAATSLPVSADLENCFGADAEGVGETIGMAIVVGLAGCSIEDSTGDPDEPIFEISEATERVRAATEAAHLDVVHFVVTARAENYLHGRPDLSDTIRRLQAYEEAGADVLYAPGLSDLSDIRRVVESVGLPVNVLARKGVPPVGELAAAGVKRISVGGAFAFAAYGAMVEAAAELRDSGTFGWLDLAARGSQACRQAFSDG